MPIAPQGSTNLAAVGVPNVYVQIVPPNPLLNGVSTDIVGVVGSASWGAVNSATTIGSLQDLVAAFGNPKPIKYDLATQVWLGMQEGASNYRCVRVTDGTDLAAAGNLLDTSAAIGAVLTGKHTGTVGNTIVARIDPGSGSAPSALTYKLTIYIPGFVPEVFDGIGGTGAVFWSNLVNAVNSGQSAARGPSNLVIATTANTLTGVTVTNAGSYATLPTLGTTGAGAGAVLNATMKAVSATAAVAGSDYATGDTITLTGGTHTINSILTVATTKLVSVAVNAGGSNYLVGDTITVGGGTFSTPAVLTVTSVSSGAVTGVSITAAGSYTVNSASLTQTATSGVGTGATFNTALFGVNTVTVSTAGAYMALPSSPVAQGTTSGSGVGATFTVLWGLLSVQVTSSGSGYTTDSAFSVTGGGGAGGATGTLVIGSAVAPQLQSPITLTGGSDGGDGVTSATLIGTDGLVRTGMYALRGTGASIAVLADADDASYFTTQVAYGLSEGAYMIGTLAAGYQDNISGAISAKQTAAVDSYAMKLMMGDWLQINDTFNNVTRFVSPQGKVAGKLATILPSGSSLNKIMSGIVGTQKTAEQRTYSDADLLQLQTNGIDLITRPIPVSATSFGVRLGCNTSSNAVINGDNYTRMVNFLGATINQGLGLFIGLPQTEDVRRQAKAAIETFLSNLQFLGMIGDVNGGQAYKVTLDASNNPSSRVALGFMQADVQVVLFSIIQRFVVNLQAGQSVQIQVLPAQLV